LKLTKSTVHRLLRSMVRAGLVEQNPENRQYMLGRETVQLGYTAIFSNTLLRTALPFLHYLTQQVGESAYLAERRGLEGAPVLQVLSPMMQEQMGWYTNIRLHATSAGKVLLAYAGEELFSAAVEQGLVRDTEYTITDPAELRREMQRVREQGYATCFEEGKLGLNTIAVPLRDPEGEVIAALAIAGPSYRLTRERALAAVEQLKAVAGEISRKLAAAS
ncbi:MAG: IclR family transcriptional regulator, partial [Anaerolineae bacterium]|nr:IclR family transcriptional regulator [Anaerolineae bacterium]